MGVFTDLFLLTFSPQTLAYICTHMTTNIAQIQNPLKPTNNHLCYGVSPYLEPWITLSSTHAFSRMPHKRTPAVTYNLVPMTYSDEHDELAFAHGDQSLSIVYHKIMIRPPLRLVRFTLW